MSATGKFSLVKPTIHTPFKIDFEWWKTHDHNWRVYLYSFLCPEHQVVFENVSNQSMIDWVDLQTAEVNQVDGLQHTLITHCAVQPEFVTSNTTLVDAVFRVLLANGNKPVSPSELSELTGKSADTILRTLSGPRVYQGIRPVQG
ncbi:MAG: hypothetical protein ACYC6H_05590 [Bellilinea sp.]